MTARRVLSLVGAPDHVRIGSGLESEKSEWREDREYGGQWSTLRITWRDHPRRPWIEKSEQVDPYCLDTDRRAVDLPCYG